LTADIAVADIVIQPETADMEREFGAVLEACFSQTPPTFVGLTPLLRIGQNADTLDGFLIRLLACQGLE
jgi:hypothetical protein